jgi:tripartite-type tricarboxylate transporter receptor subunit TctC
MDALRRRIVCATLLLGGLATAFFAAAPARAQGQPSPSGGAWPDRPIKMIVPFAAGGGTDLIARLMAKNLSERLNVGVYVENRAGANGIVGLQALKQAAPDGYTIAAASDGPLITNHALYKEKLSYDALKDFTPLGMMIKFPAVLAVHPSVPARSIGELIALMKAKPGVLNFSSGGVGNYGHLALELFMQATGTKMVHVPFSGTAPATQAVISGDVQVIYNNVASTIQAMDAKQVIGLGVGEPKRLKDLPQLPAIAETVPGFEMTAWTGLVGPADMPRAIVDRIGKEALATLNDAEVLAWLGKQQIVAQPMGPAEFGGYLKEQRAKWDKIIDSAGIRIAQ